MNHLKSTMNFQTLMQKTNIRIQTMKMIIKHLLLALIFIKVFIFIEFYKMKRI